MAQLLFVGLVAVTTIVLWRSRDTAHGKAWKRVLLLGFAGAVVFAVLFPSATTTLANGIGIGRGADLVLYLTSFALMLLAAMVLQRFRKTEERIATLTREVALAEWEREYRRPVGDSHEGS